MTGPDSLHRFPRSARLLEPPEFQAVFGEGQRFSDRYFRLHVRLREAGRPRLGLAVSRRADRSAVVRNRIKRIVRDDFRQRQAGLPPADYVLVAHAAAAQGARAGEAAALRASLERLYARSLSLKPPAAPGKMTASTSVPDAPVVPSAPTTGATPSET